jgi:hypothetical protein
MTFEQMEQALRHRLQALPPAARAELLHVLRLPDFERADRIGEFWGYPESRAFAELLIDCEEDRTLRAVLVGMLREWRANRRGRRGASLLEVPGPAAVGEHDTACLRRVVGPRRLGVGGSANRLEPTRCCLRHCTRTAGESLHSRSMSSS